ncbi:MAG TPA: family 43 glycosylhydrolase [Actinoplanes sp.]|nr:family 43 glycosylhydrolase [Actinoplanes sp.]
MTDYRNPILYADWPDPDVIRSGGDYYLVASSFNRVPGLPLLHSTDLVRWRIIGHALQRLVPEEWYRVPRPGCGVWAPSIRQHDGRFWICWPDPDRGIYVTTADHPAGEWSAPSLVLPGRGLIDPCPLWDDDGRAYLVHGWAKSRCGFNNRLRAYEMNIDLSRPVDQGHTIVDGDAIPGCRTLEGPKWYRRDGWYWIFAPGGGVAQGWQYAMRSRQVFGPYEPRIVLAQGDTDINGPHQGAWVGTPAGEDWFVHFQDLDAYGRVVHLQPMTWDEDGWPVIGAAGTPVRTYGVPATRVPTLALTGSASASAGFIPALTGSIAASAGSPSPSAGETAADFLPAGGWFSPSSVGDTFPGGRPGPQWSWPANPSPEWIIGHSGDGLRLRCVPDVSDLRTAPNLLGQPLPGPHVVVETEVRLAGAVGSRAGLAVHGRTYAWIGLEKKITGTFLTCRFAETECEPGKEARVEGEMRADSEGRVAPQGRVDGVGRVDGGTSAVGEMEKDAAVPVAVSENVGMRLRLTVTAGVVTRFAAEYGGERWECGSPFTATPGRWIGATLSLFAVGPSGHADFSHLRITGPGTAAGDRPLTSDADRLPAADRVPSGDATLPSGDATLPSGATGRLSTGARPSPRDAWSLPGDARPLPTSDRPAPSGTEARTATDDVDLGGRRPRV